MNNAKKAALILATAGMAAGAAAGSAAADSGAQGVAAHSPGVLSGNTIQVPVHVPINLCGNTISIIGALNPAFGNTCVNG
ncbi:chaplin [Streptomyces sp. NPDC002580]|uniref:chaplin n=1 Tax=Streptomyces sp. NPDC002580 TaxID=3364653 RepID=UPI00368D3AB0